VICVCEGGVGVVSATVSHSRVELILN